MKTLREHYNSLAMDIFNVIRSNDPRKMKEERRDELKSRMEKLDRFYSLEEKTFGRFRKFDNYMAAIHQSSETASILMFQLNEQLETH